MPIWSNWAEEPAEVNGASESECSGEDDYVTADEGYDADVELRTNLCKLSNFNFKRGHNVSRVHLIGK